MNTMPAAGEADRTLAAVTARLLRACTQTAGAVGLGCAGIAAAALLWRAPAPPALLLAVLGALPVERVLALRLWFDAGLFADLGRSADPPALAALDQALQALRLRPATATLRPLTDRARGAQRLVFWHLLCVALQAAGLLAAGWTSRAFT